ncbi:MAG: ABC transporter ATP-binding protein/permease [Lachnospiraceae bacterium]|nr:ABC transporter ATP-binding protein/permease [Lachnospiraceae bacterium]
MLRKISYILNRHQKIRLMILMAMIFVGAFVELLGVSAVLPLVSAVTNPEVIHTNSRLSMIADFLGITDIRISILYMALLLVVIYIFKNIYITCMYDVTYRFTYNNQRRISNRMMECYLSQDYLFHVSHNVSELMRNISSDVNGFFTVVLAFLQMITEASVCAVLSIYLFIKDAKTTLMLVALLAVFLYVVMIIFKKKLKKMGQESREVGAQMNRAMLQAFGGIKEVKVANTEKYFTRRYDENYKKFALIQQRQLLLNIVPRPIMETVCICGLLLFMSIRIYMGEDMKSFVPVMSVFAIAAIRMLPSFNRISGYIGNIMFGMPSVDAVYNDLKGIEGLRQKFEEDDKDDTKIEVKDALKVSDVTFAYPSRPDKVILDHVDLTIPANKSVAFIGPSGAGKTTLADVILGVLKPDGGHILADETDVYKHPHAWHKIVGYIPQAIYLTDETVRSNVAFGIEPEEIDDERVWLALKEAQLDEFIREQPKGLDTNIGDRGVKLSGGQRQRIGIARALYRNPKVLVLDEATAALDTETETAVMEAIDSLAGTKTMIIIAHRLTTIRNCDLIYEIRDGKAALRKKEDVLG